MHRGARKRCPRCGQGRLFRGWYTLHERCSSCDLEYEPLEGNSWWFMYYTTAFFTGLIILGMLLTTPDNQWIGRGLILVAWMGCILATMPYRKGVAIALDYFTEHRTSQPPPRSED